MSEHNTAIVFPACPEFLSHRPVVISVITFTLGCCGP